MKGKVLVSTVKNCFSTQQVKRKSELKIVQKLKSTLNPTFLCVEDTTLGANSCGQMFKIFIESPLFNRKTRVEQHMLVTNALSSQIKNIHAFNLKTRIPKNI